MLRVLVADHDESSRANAKAALGARSDFHVTEAASRRELLARAGSGCDLVLLEPLLSRGDEVALVKRVCQVAPRAHVLVVTEMDELRFGLHALRNGAKGCVMKGYPPGTLLAAALRVAGGGIHMSEALAEEIAITASRGEAPAWHRALTKRQRQIFAMLVSGWNISTIASTLRLGIPTVLCYKSGIHTKLGCKSLNDLVQYATDQGLAEQCQQECEWM
jgi:DNA-binding NarL/FixJ family response regulator